MRLRYVRVASPASSSWPSPSAISRYLRKPPKPKNTKQNMQTARKRISDRFLDTEYVSIPVRVLAEYSRDSPPRANKFQWNFKSCTIPIPTPRFRASRCQKILTPPSSFKANEVPRTFFKTQSSKRTHLALWNTSRPPSKFHHFPWQDFIAKARKHPATRVLWNAK